MVLRTIVTGVYEYYNVLDYYKPTYNVWGPHCMIQNWPQQECVQCLNSSPRELGPVQKVSAWINLFAPETRLLSTTVELWGVTFSIAKTDKWFKWIQITNESGNPFFFIHGWFVIPLGQDRTGAHMGISSMDIWNVFGGGVEASMTGDSLHKHPFLVTWG